MFQNLFVNIINGYRRIIKLIQKQNQPMLGIDAIGLPGTTIYVIGPEGGFSEREIALLNEAAYRPVSFGQRILRCETAATLCLGLHWWASQQQGRPDCPGK